MIDWLEIRQLAIAEHLELEFGAAFTAVTGETGSGKSLIVDAVGVLLGDRAENALIRARQPQAEIEGGFRLTAAHPALLHLRAHGLDNALECILRRVVRRDKPSRAFINGRAVNASMLRELGRELVDIHGQHEHHSLLSRAGQLTLLDAAAANGELLARIGGQYEALSETRARIERLRGSGESARMRAELLTQQVAELEALAPQADEWPQLEQRQKRMHHERELAVETREAALRLRDSENDSLAASLSECARRLQRLLEYDPRLGKIIELLGDAGIHIGEAAEQLQALYSGGAPDAAEIAEIEARFSLYHELSRKHRVLPGLLAEKLDDLRAELAGLQDPQAELQHLEAKQAEHRAAYDELAEAIGARRRESAARLAADVTALMQELGMAGGSLEIRLHPANAADPEHISRRGAESAEFAASANPGLPPQPLTKAASGGELSRISLAINVALAAGAPASTLIFDEVDVGIGGRVAEVVGEKLRQLGGSRQIICITHLSQVAAKAQHHWSVIKHAELAEVSVRALDHAQRIEEIARMAAGAELTPQSLAHAEQMLQSA
ncbi:MAG: DNA repair protein RecN [Gammaproteobacteria bacterium]